MAKLVFGMNLSLDGYVDHDHEAFTPDPLLFRHWIDHMRGLAGSVYGRRTYEIMRCWDETILSGARSTVRSRRRGEASRNGSCPAR